MVQSRELLDTIVKENKGKDTNSLNGLNVGQILQNCPIYFFFSSCLWNHDRLWQVCPDSHSRQQAQVRIIPLFMFVTDRLIVVVVVGGGGMWEGSVSA